MTIFKKIKDLQEFLQLQNGKIVGFVPTMGALHNGHRSLIEKAKANAEIVVCSIFVNPTQFNDKADFEKYPVTTDADIALLMDSGCDVLFLPEVAEMYPDGLEKGSIYDFGYLETVLEGAMRPGHFKGVGQIVSRLLNIVQPNKLFMGQKDYQQCMIVRDLLRQMGKADTIELVICPTRREADGLAMSSRNRRLSEPQRVLSGILYQCLVSIQSKKSTDSFALVQKECTDLLKAKGIEPEYVALADAGDLKILDNYDGNDSMVALIAAKVGNVRLIDNLILE
ncbi:pantoate--beta-alanine ligase [Taibaiella soli]|uniref:Pantothenate synthetase n=2 Tax=Taibaiella soli TaxID=1649169 RepID=A0A2W2BEK5_9BACT|nr:pantoate--beta-alanine ligase [Taibaiella soli]